MKYSIFKNLLRNLLKGKFYAIFRSVWDEEYRADVLHLHSLLTRTEMSLSHGQIPLRSIVPGHAINYPEWVQTLCDQIRSKGWNSIEPIKVTWDNQKYKWLVVDGNHRLAALAKSLPPWTKIPVIIVRSKNIGMNDYQAEMIKEMTNDLKHGTFTLERGAGKMYSRSKQ